MAMAPWESGLAVEEARGCGANREEGGALVCCERRKVSYRMFGMNAPRIFYNPTLVAMPHIVGKLV